MNHLQALEQIEKAPLSKAKIDTAKLSDLWEKIRPLVMLLGTIFGRKLKPYLSAFVTLLDELTTKEEVTTRRKK